MEAMQLDVFEAIKNHIYEIPVDYTKSIQELLKIADFDWEECGEYRKNDVLSFPHPYEHTGKKTMKMKIFRFYQESVYETEVIKKMDDDGYRPANIIELISLSLKHPYIYIHEEDIIWAIGSKGKIISNKHYHDSYPILTGNDKERMCMAYTFISHARIGYVLKPDKWTFLGVQK